MSNKDPMSWIDEQEKKNSEKSYGDYFNIQEGDNRIQLLSYIAPLHQVWDSSEKKYRIPKDGEPPTSIKGVCWVLQDGIIKSARLPYTVVKGIRELQSDPDYSFDEFPMPRMINIKAKNAGTKEVEYTVIPSPKVTPVNAEILEKLETMSSPEEIVEKINTRGQFKSYESQRRSEEVDATAYMEF